MKINLAVPHGKVKFVFFSEKFKKFRTIIIGEKNYKLISVPPKIWFGFMGISKHKSLIINLASHTHSKKEILRKKIKDINFNWKN